MSIGVQAAELSIGTKPGMPDSIGIVGKGFVGTTIANYYREHGFDVKSFDIRGDCDAMDEVAAQDIVFVAIMLPDNGQSATDKVSLLQILSKMPEGCVVVLKSTVVPGTTQWLQGMFPQLNMFFNPEFLTEATAAKDFSQPPFAILGVTDTSDQLQLVRKVQGVLPTASPERTFVVGASEAEMIKTVRNSYLALKLTAFNQVYDVCSWSGVNYEIIRDILAQDEWIGDSHNIIWHKGKRGFSGKCLPKDLHNLVRYCEDMHMDIPLFGCAENLNKGYLAQRREEQNG